LWEKGLIPPEEKIVREHLSSCQECQQEFERFEKMMGWLRSVGEERVPDGFFPELQKKLEERKDKAILTKRAGGRWLGFPLSLKLPVQAVAMVAIVFLVLYLAKMMPTEMYRLKGAEQTPSPLSAEKKSGQLLSQREAERGALETPPEASRHRDVEQAKAPVPAEGRMEEGSIPQVPVEKKAEQMLAQKGVEKERRTMGATAETSRLKDVEQPKSSLPREEKLKEAYVPPVRADAKKMETPAPGTDVMGYRTFNSKEAARAQVPSPEPAGIEGRLVAKEKSIAPSKPPREIALRVSDREKVTSKLHELVKQFGGEIVTSEENMLLVSLPTGSFSGFEKELAGLSLSTNVDKVAAKKQASGSAGATPGRKREEVDEKNEERAKSVIDQESRTVVRILLIPE
jgi:hypothetical protein